MSKKKKPYTVGYRKPPQHTKFKPGQSGNPKGRAKRDPKSEKEEEEADLCSDIDKELQAKIWIVENGERFLVTKQQAIAKQTVNKALSGDPKSIGVLMNPHTRTALEKKLSARIEAKVRSRAAVEDEDLSKYSPAELLELIRQELGEDQM